MHYLHLKKPLEFFYNLTPISLLHEELKLFPLLLYNLLYEKLEEISYSANYKGNMIILSLLCCLFWSFGCLEWGPTD